MGLVDVVLQSGRFLYYKIYNISELARLLPGYQYLNYFLPASYLFILPSFF